MFASQENMKSIDRLKKRSDFLYVQKNGQKWIAKTMIVEICPNQDLGIRFGLTVSKKVSKLAVLRNRLKRRLRSACLNILGDYKLQNVDIVVVGRVGAENIAFDTLQNDLRWCLKKMDIYPDVIET